jgi:hypothetical protein
MLIQAMPVDMEEAALVVLIRVNRVKVLQVALAAVQVALQETIHRL